jgi:hypothetical protein
LNTLLAGEDGASKDDAVRYGHSSEKKSTQQNDTHTSSTQLYGNGPRDITASASSIDPVVLPCTPHGYQGYDHLDSDNEHYQHTAHRERIHIQEGRTLLVTNLSDRTTHKDLATVVRGGRLLEIYIRNDRSATISFVEGASEFLAYAKRNDIYLHTKRVSSLVEGYPKLTSTSLSSVGTHVNSMSQLTSYTRSAVEPLGISSYAGLPAR